MENIIRGTTPTLIVDFTGVLDVSTIDNNVWEPGVYGWEIIT